ncbi:MAG: hypothetical protein Q8730_02425, partial [Sweet potato little leaf phytoplasma]|nr:hypothetical protein [Sweet potato little leaf phytoplasma]
MPLSCGSLSHRSPTYYKIPEKEFDNNNIKLERFNNYYKKNDYIESNIQQIKACYIPDTQTM